MLVLGIKLKWAFCVYLLFFGLAFLGLTVYCGLRYRKLHKELSHNDINLEKDADLLHESDS